MANLRFPSRILLAEGFGTFCLVFAGTGSVIANDTSGGAVTHVGVALTFGLIVLAMIYALGDVSGAHINPAVTVGFCVAGRMGWREAPPYLVGQMGGAFLASGLLKLCYPAHGTLGATVPAVPWPQAFLFEFVLTLMLMLVILSVSTGAAEKGITAGIAIGAVVALEVMFAGPVTGASMNPARSLAPGLLSGALQGWWIYLVAPVLGAVVASSLCFGLRGESCCGAGPRLAVDRGNQRRSARAKVAKVRR